MKRFSELSLLLKLAMLVIGASSAALLAAFLAITLNEMRTFSPRARENLTSQAATVGFHASAAMVFLDEEDAAHTLAALRMNSSIMAAALYTPDGRLFSQYLRPDASADLIPATPVPTRGSIVERKMAIVHPVLHEGENVGTLYMLSDLSEFYTTLVRNVVAAALLMAIGILVAVALSTFLSRALSAPIQELARVAEHVTRDKDYTLRATRHARDEVGVLIDAFNEMLARILERDNELRRIQSDLEVRVRERTAELESINRSLIEEVNARRSVEAQLIVARDRAEAASRAKSTFLANMSHDLRTPLTAVIGYSEMLEEDARDKGNSDIVEDLRRIQVAANHLLSLLSDLLDLSRIEAGRMELQPESVDLSAFVRELEPASRMLCDANHNRLTIACLGDLGRIDADRTRLRQVLYNLISNAAKFTRNGEVRLAVARVNGQDPAGVRFDISDTGIGIAPENLERIFEPFVQAEATTAITYGGSGLGLAICRRCCELMHGSITVASVLGKGTTFTVQVPTATLTDAAR